MYVLRGVLGTTHIWAPAVGERRGELDGRPGSAAAGTCSQISFQAFQTFETFETLETFQTFQTFERFLGGRGGLGRLRRPGQESDTSTSKPLILTVQKLTSQGQPRQRLVNAVFGLEYIGILSQRLANIRFSEDRARSPEQGLVNRSFPCWGRNPMHNAW